MLTNWIIVALTFVIAASTVIYTIFTFLLWKGTRASSRMAQCNAFTNWLYGAEEVIRKGISTDPRGVQLLRDLIPVMVEMNFQSQLKNSNLRKNIEAQAQLARIK